MNCEHLNTCSYIQYMNMKIPFIANTMKIKYCEFNYDKCARHRLARICHMENIPFYLHPTDETKANELMVSKLKENRDKLYEGSNVDEVMGAGRNGARPDFTTAIASP